MTGTIGIALGDITGVGPEVALKAIAEELSKNKTRFLIIGDEEVVRQTNARLGLNLSFTKDAASRTQTCVVIANPLTDALPPSLPHGSPKAANAAVAWLKEGAELCLRNKIDALVTAPVNKEAIVRAGHDFVGQTEFLSAIAGTKRTAMMLLGQDDKDHWLRVALVTTHIPIKQVAEKMTPDSIMLAIELAVKACHDLGLPRARIAVCGLNPHAGEGGKMGDEEITIISPTVLAAQKKGFEVIGPLSGDTVFYHALRGEFDAVVAMYHDQGLAPLKAVAFDTGVNWTLGLPFIRTSPDHGTAYDIAGKGIANPSSMIAAIRLAKQLVRTSK